MLHDIGKIAIPDAILKKASRLTDEEYAIMKTHPVRGRKILAGLSFLPQADFLMSLGCRYAQGYFFGKPQPANELLEKLQAEGISGKTDCIQ